MVEIKTIDIKNMTINDKIKIFFKEKRKNEISLKAWSFLYDILKEYNINILEEKIIYNKYGKPFIENNKIYFNISHSKDLIAIIISDKNCAIDIQYVNANKSHEKYIDNILSKKEKDIYNKINNKNEYFYMIWTKKETIFKYDGTGIIFKQLNTLDKYEEVNTTTINHLNDIYYLSYK